MKIKIPVSAGEIIDKFTILEIKKKRIKDKLKVSKIRTELKELLPSVKKILTANRKLSGLKRNLYEINCRLWDIENSIRSLESEKDYGKKFVTLARSVYINNDKRAELKNEINKLSGSEILEVKQYSRY